MKVYTCTGFEGHWPVGTAAVVVAESCTEAVKLLNNALVQAGLQPSVVEAQLNQVPQTRQQAIILLDGNY